MGDSIKNERALLLLLFPTETPHYVLECLCDSIVMRKFTLFNSIPVQTLGAKKLHLSVSTAHLSSEADVREWGKKCRGCLREWTNTISVSLGKKWWCSDVKILVQPETPVKHRTHFYMLLTPPWHFPVCHLHTEIWRCNSYTAYLFCGKTTGQRTAGVYSKVCQGITALFQCQSQYPL